VINPATPEEIPLFPLQSVLFPDGPLPLRIFEPRYVDLIGRCLRSQSGFGVVLIHEGGEVGKVAALADVGTHARIEDFNPLPDGLLGIFCRGGRRFRLLQRRQADDGLHVGTVEWLSTTDAPLPPQFAPLAQLLEQVLPELGALYATAERRFDDADWVGCRLAEILPIEQREKQRLLEAGPLERLTQLAPLLAPADCHTRAP
jgi:Lon protease-like protein